jgi:antitoxin ParD1/3/4
MNVSLTPQLDNFVKSLVKTGHYNNASEVVRAALRLLKDQERLQRERLRRLRRELDKGYADIAAGRVLEFRNADELAAYFTKR